MIFESVLKTITPSASEEKSMQCLVTEILSHITHIAREKNIPAQPLLVGSVAKGTWLRGEADIDIFIAFPLEYGEEDLKEQGLDISKKCIKLLKGDCEKRYASHPYITGFIKDYEVDFVPCYAISKGQKIKSAVDRTILHMQYIKTHLDPEDQKEVLLLKRFMQMVGTYGSEFKVGGFAGYLCELLILHYGTFLRVLEAAAYSWNPGYSIDLEGYHTALNFQDPLVVIDPVDKNRNVASSLSLQKMSEFVVASYNFLKDKNEKFFYPAKFSTSREELGTEFSQRGTETILINFKTPPVPADALHPQIKKTEHSLVRIMKKEGFRVMGSDYWTDEKECALILLELEGGKLPPLKVHQGPMVWNRSHGQRFCELHPQSWVQDDRWTTLIKREFTEADALLRFLFSEPGLPRVRGGKHVKKSLLKGYSITSGDDSLGSAGEDLLKFFYTYLHKGWQLTRDHS